MRCRDFYTFVVGIRSCLYRESLCYNPLFFRLTSSYVCNTRVSTFQVFTIQKSLSLYTPFSYFLFSCYLFLSVITDGDKSRFFITLVLFHVPGNFFYDYQIKNFVLHPCVSNITIRNVIYTNVYNKRHSSYKLFLL